MLTSELKEKFDKATSRNSLAVSLYGYYNATSKKRLESLCNELGFDLSLLDVRIGNANRKYQIVTKSCPICEKRFETKINHRDEKTTCSFACSNTYYRSGSNHGNYVHGKSVGRKPIPENKGKTKSQIQKEYFSRNPDRVKELHLAAKEYYIKYGVKEETRKKLSDAVRSRIDAGTHKGWAARPKGKASYPEQFFMKVLKNNNINYTFELKQGNYFIDFAITSKKIALEIDGKQHELPERKASDERKDEYLTSEGWNVYRIKWKSLHNDAGKAYIKEEIRKFVAQYNATPDAYL